MQSNIQEIFERIPSIEELKDIKNKLNDNEYSTWSDLYWAVKCLCVYDAEACESELLIGSIEKMLDLGLNIQTDSRKYLDIIKVLVILYSQNGEHYEVIKVLQPLIENTHNMPDWVYHDYILAELEVDEFLPELEETDSFLEMLDHNQRNSKLVLRKQMRIFKEYLNKVNSFNMYSHIFNYSSELTKAAKTFELDNSDGWKEFSCQLNKHGLNGLEKYEEKKTELVFDEAEIEPEIKGHLNENYAKSLRELEVQSRELEKRRLELEEKEKELIRLVEENKSLAKDVKSSEDEKKKMEEMINYAEKENERLRQEIEDKVKQTEDEFSFSVSDPKEQLIGHMHSFQYSIQIALTKWLNKNLPDCERDWWDNCVIKCLSYEQRERAYERGYTLLKEFDLPALLRIMSRNWYKLKKMCYLAQSDNDCLQKMFDVRNRWAHNKLDLPPVDVIKDDIEVIISFMTFLGCSRDKVKDVQKYLVSVDKTFREG